MPGLALRPMITKAQVKEIRALATAKGRREWNAFAAEGDKMAREWLGTDQPLRYVAALPDWILKNQALIERHPEAELLELSEDELHRISVQQSPNGALVVAPMPPTPEGLPANEWCLVLEQIQDPGNLGTIIRIADWFGVKHVVCSPGCADYYNAKVLSAAMGGHLRVQLHTASLPQFLETCRMPVLAATLHGKSTRDADQYGAAALLIGNESKGLSAELLRFATEEVTIRRRGGAESLNAAVSAGILLATLLPE